LAEGAASAPPNAAIHVPRRSAWRTERNGPKAGGGERVDRCLGQKGNDYRQRPRPEFPGKQPDARVDHAVAPGHRNVCHVADKGIEARPPLGRKDARDGFAVRGVGGEPVDRFGGQYDERATPQRRGSFRHRGGTIGSVRMR